MVYISSMKMVIFTDMKITMFRNMEKRRRYKMKIKIEVMKKNEPKTEERYKEYVKRLSERKQR